MDDPCPILDRKLTYGTGDEGEAKGTLVLRYGDPEFDRKIGSAGKIDTLCVHGLPQGVRMRQGMDERGFYFWFEDGFEQLGRYFHPSGLREIKINGQSLDIDLEKLWLIDSFIVRYNKHQASFASLNSESHIRELFSYFCRLSRMSTSKLEHLSMVLCNATDQSDNPYFRIYLADVLMASCLRTLIESRFRVRRASLDEESVTRVFESALALLLSAQTNCKEELGKLGETPDCNQIMPLAAASQRLNASAFWSGAYYQATRRAALLTAQAEDITGGKMLDLLTDFEMQTALRD